MAAKGLFLAVALVAFAGCVAIDVEPLVEPIVALEEIEGAAPAAKTDGQPSKQAVAAAATSAAPAAKTDGQPSKQAVAAAATKQLPVEKGSTAVADNNSAEKFSTPMAAVDQPQMSAAEHAKLKSTLSGRKRTRLIAEVVKAKEHAERMSIEWEIDQKREKQAVQALSDANSKKLNSLRDADKASDDIKNLERKLRELHKSSAGEQTKLEMAKHQEDLQKGMVRASAIEEEMSSSEQSGSSTGDRKLNLKRDAQRRKFNKGLYDWTKTQSKNSLAAVKTEQRAYAAQKLKVEAVQETYQTLNKAVGLADRRKAGAEFDADNMDSKIKNAEETIAQKKAIVAVSKTRMDVAKKMALAAKDMVASNKQGGRAEIMAESLDPEVAKEAAVKSAIDHDGLGDKGEQLVAKDGAIARKYETLFNQMKTPVQSNPLLDAEARAALKGSSQLPSIKSEVKSMEGNQ